MYICLLFLELAWFSSHGVNIFFPTYILIEFSEKKVYLLINIYQFLTFVVKLKISDFYHIKSYLKFTMCKRDLLFKVLRLFLIILTFQENESMTNNAEITEITSSSRVIIILQFFFRSYKIIIHKRWEKIIYSQ